MAGLYIHIPFCRSLCIYCGFYSTTALEMRQRYVDALCREMEERSCTDTVFTIYLGGGTPSQLTIPQLHQLFDHIYNINKVADRPEVTIEVNPDDVTDDFVAALSQLPVNRVSMGIQTFSNQRLRFLHRRHTAEQAFEAVDRLRKAGFSNISVDLMYGFPGETLNDWQYDITSVLVLGVEHLSAYCLTIEEETPLHRMNVAPADEETERAMYYTLIDRLAAAGYEHYEISNFARPGHRSRHNSGYWTNVPYIGLGAAAHSYDGHRRQWNVSDINTYIRGFENGTPEVGFEFIDDATRYNERVMLSLRTADGITLDDLPTDDCTYLLAAAQPHLDSGLLSLNGSCLRLTRPALFVSDMIISDLMR